MLKTFNTANPIRFKHRILLGNKINYCDMTIEGNRCLIKSFLDAQKKVWQFR